MTDLDWEVADDAEILEISADSVMVRYVPLGPNGEDSDNNDHGSVRATVPNQVVAGVLPDGLVAEGYEFHVTCAHEPTAVSVRVCRSALFTNAGSPPAWGSYSGTSTRERGPELCRAAPAGSEVELTIYAFAEVPSTYSAFRLTTATESSGCAE